MYMSSQNPKFRITQSLLSSWLWVYKKDDGYEDFLSVLNREKKPPTQAMLDGQHFENLLNRYLDGNPYVTADKFAAKVENGVKTTAEYLWGAQQQVTLFKEISVRGVPFLLHGVLDFLKAGIIYDTKFSKNYDFNKYLHSPQHPMYFALVPEAYEFQYLSCDGEYLYREIYRPEDCVPIDVTIGQFMDFLEQRNLIDTYCEKWKVKN